MGEQLTHVQSALDILKYWLNAVRFEEGLTARPRAIRGQTPHGGLKCG